MKNIKFYFRILPAAVFLTLMSACKSDMLIDEPGLNDNGGITFMISAPVEETWLTRGADGDVEEEKLQTLRYLVADNYGNVLDHYYGKLSEDLDRLTLDGLLPGDYSLLLLGASGESALADIKEPARISDEWLSNTLASAPLEGSYFFKKVDFSVDLEPGQLTKSVTLERPMTRVDVEIPGICAAVEEMIESVKITFDDDCLYGAMNADGSFSGTASVKGYEMRDSLFNLTFHTFPSSHPVSGTVSVKAATMSGQTLTSNYRFENIPFEAGKVATVSLKLNHPDMNTGFILVRPRDYFDYDADIMMMEDEPLDVLHDNNHRRFQVCKPLTVSTWEKNMRVRLFMGAPVEDVDIYANFPSLGLDSVKIAHFDKVEPMLDMLVPMPFLERECKYYDVHGNRVTIPKLGSIPANIEWSYKTPDAYLKQLSELKFQRWYAWCPSYETWWARYAITPTNDIIRHGYMICQCMAITYDSEEFYTILAENEGTYVNDGVYLTNEDIINRIYNMAGFGWGSCNPASGAVGWGGGSTMIFMASYFPNMYPGVTTNNPVRWERETLFHEFGHCLGFSHSGNMTYGKKWVTVSSTAYVNCFLHGKIPYGTPDFMNSVPYRRADAPKWAKPRFVIPEEPAEEGEVVKNKRANFNEAPLNEPIS